MQTVHEMKEICCSFFDAMHTATAKVQKADIYNVDQTPCYFDAVRNTSLHFRGDKQVEVNTTGHSKDRFTACLVASADGRQLAGHVVFKGKRQPKQKLPANVTVDVAEHGKLVRATRASPALPTVPRMAP